MDDALFLYEFANVDTDEEFEWYKSQISPVILPYVDTATDDNEDPLPFLREINFKEDVRVDNLARINDNLARMEDIQRESATEVISQINNFIIVNQQDYDNAAELCKDIKHRFNQIVDYWKPVKDTAYKTWKDICNKEKQLTAPFLAAESEIKSKMVLYQKKRIEEERLLKEEQERWKKEEEERLLAAAVKAEEAGQQEHADYLVEVAEETKNMVFEQPKQHKTSDTAAKKVWKARVTNPELVPVKVMNTIIRPVDLKALDKLAKFCKGNMEIPGIEFYEDVQISVRTR